MKTAGFPRACLRALTMAVAIASPAYAQRAAPAVRPALPDATAVDRERATAALNKLPIWFEPTEQKGTFLARGMGAAVRLTGRSIDFPIRSQNGDSIRVQFAGARKSSRVIGVDPLPGRINYLLGDDRARWRTNVPTYARARTVSLYRGIDIDYYGSDDQLEYDLVVNPGSRVDQIRLAVSGASSVAISEDGDVVYGDNHRVLLRKPIGYQTIDGMRRDVPVEYRWRDDRTLGFVVGTFNRHEPLIIDPVVVYSFLFGGTLAEEVFDIAVDDTGASYVAGKTESRDFPTVNPAQGPGSRTGFTCIAPHDDIPGVICTDGFLAKVATIGATLEYATYIDGGQFDSISHIAVDASYALYFTGSTDGRSIVGKLSPDGSQILYKVLPAASVGDIAAGDDGSAYVTTRTGVAALSPVGEYRSILDLSAPATFTSITAHEGSLYVSGQTSAPNFVTTAGVIQQNLANHRLAIFREGQPLAGVDKGLEDWPGVFDIAISVADPGVRYAIKTTNSYAAPTPLAVSLDGGTNWVPTGFPPARVLRIVTDPHDRLTAYAVETEARLWKTTNAGTTFTALNVPGSVQLLLISPTDGTLYITVTRDSQLVGYKSVNGGSTWTVLSWPRPPTGIDSLGRVYATGLLRTSDDGLSWDEACLDLPPIYVPCSLRLIATAASQPSTLYALDFNGNVHKSTDDGGTFTVVLSGFEVIGGAIHPTSPETVILYTASGVLRTTNGGANWTTLPLGEITAAAFDPVDPTVVLIGQANQRDGFVMRLTPDGEIVYSTLLGGSGDEAIADIAVDSDGAVYAAGETSSPDFLFDRGDTAWVRAAPLRTFVVKLRSDGRSVGYAVPLPNRSSILPTGFVYASQTWGAVRIAVDVAGSAYTAACTPYESPDTCHCFRISANGTSLRFPSSVPSSRLFALDRSGAQYFAETVLSLSSLTLRTQVALTKSVWDIDSATISTNVILPARFGTAINWTAAAGGGGPGEYSFWRYDLLSHRWTEVQGYSPDASYTWTPASWDVGDHYLCVFVRLIGSPQIPVSACVDVQVTGVESGEPPVLAPSADFDADQRPDVIWTNHGTGGLATWQLGGGAYGEQVRNGGYLTGAMLPAGWRVTGSGDVDGDGHTDLVLQSDTGMLGVWMFDGLVLRNGMTLTPGQVDPQWKIRAVGDLNHDGHPDLIWQYAPTGQVAFWLMNGTIAIDYIVPNVAAPGSDWEIVGTGDSNRDGERDIFWQQRSTGILAVWWMNGTAIAGASLMSASPDPKWRVVAVADVDGDAYSDLLFQHADSNVAAVWYLQDATVRFGLMLNPSTISDPAWKIAGPR